MSHLRATGKTLSFVTAPILLFLRGTNKTLLWSAPTNFLRSQIATISRLITNTQGSAFTSSTALNPFRVFTIVLTFIQHVGRGGVQTAITIAFTQAQNFTRLLASTRQTISTQASSYGRRLAAVHAYLVTNSTLFTPIKTIQRMASWTQSAVLRSLFGINAFAVTLAFTQRVGHAKQFVTLAFQQTQGYLVVIGRSLQINLVMTQAQLISTARATVRSFAIFAQGIAPFQQSGQGSLFALSLSTTAHVFFSAFTAIQSTAFSLSRALGRSWKASEPVGLSLRKNITRAQLAVEVVVAVVNRGLGRSWITTASASYSIRRGVGSFRVWNNTPSLVLIKNSTKSWLIGQSTSVTLIAARVQKLVTLAMTQAQSLVFARQIFFTRAISQGQGYVQFKAVSLSKALVQTEIYRTTSRTAKALFVITTQNILITRATRHFIALQAATIAIFSTAISQVLEFIAVTQQTVVQIRKRVGKRVQPSAVVTSFTTIFRRGTHRIKKILAWKFMGD